MESKTPIPLLFPNFPKENNLEPTRLAYWLSVNLPKNGSVTLSHEVKCFLYDKIIKGELIYGQIPLEYVLPYLKLSKWTIGNVRSIALKQGNDNLKFIADRFSSINLSSFVADFFKYKQFGEDYQKENKYISISNHDDFPLIHIEKDGISYSPLPYGVINPYSWLGIKSLYGLSREKYIDYYDNLSPLSTLGYDIVDNGLYSEAIFSDVGNWIRKIINLPALEAKLKTKRTTAIVYSLSYGSHHKIIKNIQDPKLASFCRETILRVENFPFLYTKPDSIPDVSIVDFMNNETMCSIVSQSCGSDSFPSSPNRFLKLNWKWICTTNPVAGWLDTCFNYDSNLTHLRFNCALRKFLPPLNCDNNAMIIICSMLDYGLPGKDIDNTNIYPEELVRYLVSLIHPYTEYLGLENLFRIEEGILDTELFTRILKRGYINPLPLTGNELIRYNKWSFLEEREKYSLKILYSRMDLKARDYVFMKDIQERPEKMIDDMNINYLEEQMLSYGMVHPHGANSLVYFIGCLYLYNNPLFGSGVIKWSKPSIEDLNNMTDKEIIDEVLEGYPGHSSREDLLEIATNYILGDNSFILMKDNSSVESREELYKYISEGPSPDSNLLFRYDFSGETGVPITLSELYVMNKDIITDDNTVKDVKVYVYTGENDDNGVPITKTLSLEEMEMFTKVLHCAIDYINQPSDMKSESLDEEREQLEYLCSRTRTAIAQVSHNYVKEREVIKQFNKLPNNTKQLIVKGLIAAFDCGMLQRQWKGVRGEYPYTSDQAGTEEGYETKKDLIVGQQLHLLNEVFLELKSISSTASLLFESLRVVALKNGSGKEDFTYEMYRDNNNIKQYKTLKMLFDDISKGEDNGGLCIRLGSSKFIWTAYYWLKLFDNVRILGTFDVTKTVHFG